MKITLAQINPIIGDIQGNIGLMEAVITTAEQQKSDLVIFPECALTGYPPRDLLGKAWFLKQIKKGIANLLQLSRSYPDLGILFGTPYPEESGDLSNAALLCHAGECVAIVRKTCLPIYDIFDEPRYFTPADDHDVIQFKEHRLGVSICEDAWRHQLSKLYPVDPMIMLAEKGATLFINISASPFEMGKFQTRLDVLVHHATHAGIPLIHVNQVGGNDDLIFDGRSFVCHSEGQLTACCKAFETDIKTITIEETKGIDVIPMDNTADVYQALCMGLSDYVRKCGFKKVILGLSGGIDSAVTCAIAVAALGSDCVQGYALPSPYSSKGSIDDALQLADHLGISCETLRISETMDDVTNVLSPVFKDLPSGLAEENIQARIRGVLLMAISNKFGHLLLSTGNKSELAVGYCTLYGDMNGGLSVLSDVPKTLVYQLAAYINQEKECIPISSIEKPPSAELRPNQTDQDSLPPYDLLDKILKGYIEDGLSLVDLCSDEVSLETVKWVVTKVNQNEHKRRQAALGLKVTSKAFGSGRRMPIAAHWSLDVP